LEWQRINTGNLHKQSHFVLTFSDTSVIIKRVQNYTFFMD
jgi:hypothetical protein